MVTGVNFPDTWSVLDKPTLDRFTRVLWVGDLDPQALPDSFVFLDLKKRLREGASF